MQAQVPGSVTDSVCVREGEQGREGVCVGGGADM